MTPRPVDSSADYIRRQWPRRPRVAIILGTGLGRLVEQIDADAALPYEEIPGFVPSTALSHRGQLVCGTLAGAAVVALQGRCHLYEGYSADQVTLPVRVMRRLGAELLIASNASGGLNPQFAGGDIMAVDGHVNLMGRRAAPGAPPDRVAALPACRRGASPYDPALIEQALAIARRENFVCQRGVYVAVSGPNYETRAEYRFFRRIGDAVGMSTVPEVLAAAAGGMRVLTLSTITNVARPDAPATVDAQDVVDIAAAAEPNLRKIVCGVVERAAGG